MSPEIKATAAPVTPKPLATSEKLNATFVICPSKIPRLTIFAKPSVRIKVCHVKNIKYSGTRQTKTIKYSYTKALKSSAEDKKVDSA